MGKTRKWLKDATEHIKFCTRKIVVKASRNYVAGRLRKAQAISKTLNSKVPRRSSDLITGMYLILKEEGLTDYQMAKWLFSDKWFQPVRDFLIASRPDYWVPLLIWWITSR